MNMVRLVIQRRQQNSGIQTIRFTGLDSAVYFPEQKRAMLSNHNMQGCMLHQKENKTSRRSVSTGGSLLIDTYPIGDIFSTPITTKLGITSI